MSDITERFRKVEADIAELKLRTKHSTKGSSWDSSLLRKFILVVAVYLISAATLFVIAETQFYIQALIPTGLIIVTMLVMDIAKRFSE